MRPYGRFLTSALGLFAAFGFVLHDIEPVRAAVATPTAYSVVWHHASDGAAWTQSMRVEIAPTGDSMTLSLHDAKLTIEQASPEQRPAVERAFGGFEGASAAVKIDARGNILSIGKVTSPAATDGRLPVTEEDIRRIMGLCILAMPTTAEKPAINAGDSWPADYQTATPSIARVKELTSAAMMDETRKAALEARAAQLEATRMKLADITMKDGKRIGHFVFSYQAPKFSHTRDILYDLDGHRVIKATAVMKADSDGKTATTTRRTAKATTRRVQWSRLRCRCSRGAGGG